MIKPVGSDTLQPLFVYDTEKHQQLVKEAETLPSVIISSQAAGNAVMMGGGILLTTKGLYEPCRCVELLSKHADH